MTIETKLLDTAARLALHEHLLVSMYVEQYRPNPDVFKAFVSNIRDDLHGKARKSAPMADEEVVEQKVRITVHLDRFAAKVMRVLSPNVS